jgi:hypothetical protein
MKGAKEPKIEISEVFTVENIRLIVFYSVLPCGLIDRNLCFRRASSFHFFTLKKKADIPKKH